MPRRDDIKKILIIGSGPIVIGQACEFDYSGTQACKVLKDDGYEVVLVNSNPATIMTDPEFADRTYIEPITPEWVEKIIERERPQALLPTLGGQTGLNVSVALSESGVLDKYGVEMIGATHDVISKAEDRNLFKEAMRNIGLDLPESDFAYTLKEAEDIALKMGFPLVIRPSFTLGGGGGGLAYDMEEFLETCRHGLDLSPITEILIEKSVKGWKEYELEVMRDHKDNVVIVCPIENFDPMGVHTGDSITVAPAQTLTDSEYQFLRDASIDIMREIGVETGGSNIQFAIEPDTGHVVVIEMNPRVSRSSALASKATGFPIAKIAAKLAVGYTLDEIPNDITRETPACFEPTIDYCVVKVPRWAFEKFPGADQVLTTRMKSVGEVMSIGRTFKEAMQKAIRSLEIDRYSLRDVDTAAEDLPGELEIASHDRIYQIYHALRERMPIREIYQRTGVDPWFLDNLAQIAEMEELLSGLDLAGIDDALLREAKRFGFSDIELGRLLGATELEVREHRISKGIVAVFKSVDTCASEFEAYTPYYYSTYEDEDETRASDKQKVMILGSGPNRIGQGIEFDYCCVHASFACRDLGYETIMVNCNPETVSTDYDTSDRLFFEPLTFEDVMNIVERERPMGAIIQLGGQTPLKLAIPLENAGVRILGTSPAAIDRAEDREQFGNLLKKLGIRHPEDGTATSVPGALEIARRIGYPVLVRPSYVLGGRAMEIVYSDEMLDHYMRSAVKASPEHPVLIDKFLEDAKEVDVDALCDGKRVYIGAIMEHVEEAGIHSGDSACVIPPPFMSGEVKATITSYTEQMALELGVIGLINVQYAVTKDDEVFVLEVNPRASRTVPFVSKTIGIPLAKMATRLALGETLDDLGLFEERYSALKHVAVKEAVLPFVRFPGVDTVLGPEMKSTGEVMGIDDYSDTGIGMAMVKAQIASYNHFPISGTAFISVPDKKKNEAAYIARRLHEEGFRLLATKGTAERIRDGGIDVETVNKVGEGKPDVVDFIKDGEIDLVINVPEGRGSRGSGYSIRTSATMHGIPCITTIELASIIIMGIKALKHSGMKVKSIQEYHAAIERDIAEARDA